MILAFDPDTSTSGWAALEGDQFVAAGVIFNKVKASGDKATIAQVDAILDAQLSSVLQKHPRLVVIEGQHFIDRSKSASSLFNLARITGALATACRLWWPLTPVMFANPKDWTKGIKKEVRINRMARRLGRTTPELLAMINSNEKIAMHAADAMCMAWEYKQV